MCIICGVLFYIATILPKKPSNDRDWSLEQKVLSTIEKRGDIVTILPMSEILPTHQQQATRHSTTPKITISQN